MLSRTWKFAAAVSLAGATGFGVNAVASATAGASAAAPAVAHMVPASTNITAKLKTGTNFTANGSIDGTPITVTCTSVTASGKTPADALKAPLSAPPKFTGCTDSLGGTDTVTTAGKWSVSLNSTGTQGTLHVPQNAGTFQSSILGSACTIDIAPAAKTSVKGTYNDRNTLTITNAPLPVAPSASSSCTASPTTTVSSTIVVKPGVSVAS
jgi:hypothetical protein